MTFGSELVQQYCLMIDADPVASDEIFYAMKAPREITVLDAFMVSEQTQNSGTAVKLQLENWGTAGTAIEGTVVPFLGGTASADRLTARTPKAGVVTASEKLVNKNEWLVLRYHEDGSTGWIANDRFQYVVRYVVGAA